MNNNLSGVTNVDNPSYSPKKKERDSNLELYRIIVMIAIVAHHYVVNSGLIETIRQTPFTPSSCAIFAVRSMG